MAAVDGGPDGARDVGGDDAQGATEATTEEATTEEATTGTTGREPEAVDVAQVRRARSSRPTS